MAKFREQVNYSFNHNPQTPGIKTHQELSEKWAKDKAELAELMKNQPASSPSTLETLWDNASPIGKFIYNEAADIFGAGDSYQKSLADNKKIFLQDNVTNIKDNDGALDVTYNRAEAEKLFISQLDNFVNSRKADNPAIESIRRDALKRVGLNYNDNDTPTADLGERDDNIFSRTFHWINRTANLNDDDHEYLSGLIDAFIETDEALDVLQQAKNQKNYGQKTETEKGYIHNAISKFSPLRQLSQTIGDILGLEHNDKRKMDNQIYNLFHIDGSGVDVSPYYVDYQTIKEKTNQLFQDTGYVQSKADEAVNTFIAESKRNGQEVTNEQIQAVHQQTVNKYLKGDTTEEFAKELGLQFADLIGSMRKGGSIDLFLKPVNAGAYKLSKSKDEIVEIYGELLKNKFQRIGKFLSTKQDKIIDLEKKLESNRSIKGTMKIFMDGLGSKDLKYKDVIIPSISNFAGGTISNTTKMALAVGMSNALDLGMSDEEAFESTFNLSMLVGMNNAAGQVLSRAGRAIKLVNGSLSKYAVNPSLYVKNIENMYTGLGFAGEVVSQGIMNQYNGLDPLSREAIGEHILNFGFGYHSFKTLAKNKAIIKQYEMKGKDGSIEIVPDYENRAVYKTEEITPERFGKMTDDDVIAVKTLVNAKGEMYNMPVTYVENSTPADLIKRNVQDMGLSMDNLTANNIFEMVKEQHSLQKPEVQKAFEKLLEKVGDTRVITENVAKNNNAFYRPIDKTIVFNENEIAIGTDYQRLYRDLLEETLHRVTVDAYNQNQGFREATNSLHRKIVDSIDLDKAKEDLDTETFEMLKYHLENPHELIALMYNPNLKAAKNYALKTVNKADPAKGIKGALKRLLGGKNTALQNEFDILLNDIFDGNIVIESPQQELNQNPIQTIPDGAAVEPVASVGEINPFEEDGMIDNVLPDDMLGSLPLTKNNLNANIDDVKRVDSETYTTEAAANVLNSIDAYNNKRKEVGLVDNTVKSYQDFALDAYNLYNRPITVRELNNFIDRQTAELENYKQSIDELAQNIAFLNERASTKDPKDDRQDESINLKKIFNAVNTESVLNFYAGKPAEKVKRGILKYLDRNDQAYTDTQKDLISDYFANYLTNIKSYPTVIYNIHENKVQKSYGGKIKSRSLSYYDGEMTGLKSFVKNFKLDNYGKNATALFNDLMSRDPMAIATDTKGNSPTEVTKRLLKLPSHELLRQGYYVIPRGQKSHTLLYSELLKKAANNPSIALSTAKQLFKGNFYKWLDSDATWGYSLNRPKFNDLAKHVKHDKLVEWAAGKQFTPEDLATTPESIKLLKDNSELMFLLRNKAKEYYTDDVLNVTTYEDMSRIDELILSNPEQALEEANGLLDDAITGTLSFLVDPAGTASTFKVKGDIVEAKKGPFKYEGLSFGRSPRQLNKEEYIRKYLDPNVKEADLASLYSPLGISYRNGELYQRTIVIDPSIFADHPILSRLLGVENRTDGASYVTNRALHSLYNRIMFNAKDEAVLKPRYYNYDKQGNGILWKTALFKELPDEFTAVDNPLFSNFMTNIARNAGVFTFNTALKSGHTYRTQRVPSTIDPNAYIVVNALKQPISAEKNGKEDLELFKQEFELYKQNMINGTPESKYLLEMPLTGENPIQLIGSSHEGKGGEAEAGAIGINNVPTANPNYEFWQKDDGKAYGILNKYVDNVVDKHFKDVERLTNLRRAVLDLEYGTLGAMSMEDRLSAGRALVILAEELGRLSDGDTSYDFVNNIGIENLQDIIKSSLDDDGALKPSYLKAFLSIDRFITGQQGTKAGSSSLLLHAIKRKLADAHKVRLSGSNLTLKPDMVAKSEMRRLYQYEKVRDKNNDILDQRYTTLVNEHLDLETGTYKDLTQGVSLPQETIERYNLKMGDKIFVKLTPTDDLHSFVPMIVTGMTADSGVMSINSKYATEVMGRDYDKDSLQIVVPGRQISKDDFTYLWSYFTEQGMHTGKYKSGLNELKQLVNKVEQGKRAINTTIPYKKKAHIPSMKGYAQQMRDSHVGQGRGIFVRNVIAQGLQTGKSTKAIIKNDWQEGSMSSYEKTAALTSLFNQDFVDTYGHIPYDPAYALIDVYNADSVNNLNKDVYKELEYLSNSRFAEALKANNFEEIAKLLSSNKPIDNSNSNGKFANKLKASKLNVNSQAPERIRNKILNEIRLDIEDAVNDYGFIIKPEERQALDEDINILKTILSPDFYKVTADSTAKAIAPLENLFTYFSNIDYISTDPQPYFKIFGTMFNDFANRYEHSIQERVLLSNNNTFIKYYHNGIEGILQVKDEHIPIKQLYDERGNLVISDPYSTRFLHNMITRKEKTQQLVLINKGLSDSDKSRLVGKMIGALADGKGYSGEQISYLAFKNLDGSSVGLPNPESNFGLFAKRQAELANVEAGIRSIGLVPKIDGFGVQDYTLKRIIRQEQPKYADVESQSLPLLPEQDNPELGSFLANKYEKQVVKIKKNVADYFGKKPEDINLNSLTKQEWNEVNEKILTPYVKEKLNLNSFPDQESRDAFIEEFVNQHSSNAIEQVKKYFDARTFKNAKQSEVEVPLDENGEKVYSESINFTLKHMKLNFLQDFISNIDKLNRRTSDSFYTNYALFKDNTKAALINENSKMKKSYLATDKVYPQFEFVDGKVKETKLEEAGGALVPEYNYITIGDQFDAKVGRNKTQAIFSKHYVDKILPLNAYNTLRDVSKAFLSTLDKDVFNAPFIDTMSKLETLNKDNNIYKPALDLIKTNLYYNREYNLQPQNGKIYYKNTSGVVTEGSLYNIESIRRELSNDYKAIRNMIGLEDTSESNMQREFDEIVYPSIKAYAKTNLIAKHTSDLLRDAKSKLEHEINRYSDPYIKELLMQQVDNINAEIESLESNNPNDLLNKTRGLKVSSEVAISMINEYVENPRAASVEQFNRLRKKHSEVYGLTKGGHGLLKSAIDKIVQNDGEVNLDHLLNQPIYKEHNGEAVETGEKIIDRYKSVYNDEQIKELTNELVTYSKLANNEMGLWYESLRKANLFGFQTPWKQLDGKGRAEVSNIVNNTVKKAIKDYKEKAKLNNKVYTLLGYLPDRLTVKQDIDIETLLSAFVPEEYHNQVFNYSINNLNDKVTSLLNKSVYALQKAMNIDYLKNPDPNQVVHNEILDTFASTTGANYLYNTSYDLPQISEFAKMTMQGQDIGIKPGQPLFALYKGSDGKMKQNIGRYLNSFLKPVYDEKMNIINQVPHLTMIDDTNSKTKVFTMPYSHITNIVEGTPVHLTMRSHNKAMSKYYKAFSDSIIKDLKTLTTEIQDTPTGDGLTTLNRDIREEAVSNITNNTYSLQENLNKGSMFQKINSFGHEKLIAGQVLTTYGFGKYFITTGAGIATLPFNPALGAGMLITGLGKGLNRYFTKVRLGNKLGTSAYAQSTGYTDKSNFITYGASNIFEALNRSFDVEPSKNESLAAKVITMGIEQSNKNIETQIDDLISMELRQDLKQKNTSSWEAIKKRKEFAKDRKALEEIEHIINKKYRDSPINVELLQKTDKVFKQIVQDLKSKGKKVTIKNNIPFVNGKSLIELGDMKYSVIDAALNIALLNGKMVKFEQDAAARTIAVNEKMVDDIRQAFRKSVDETERTISIPDNLVRSFLIEAKDISIGNFQKTTQSRGIPGRMLTMFRSFSKKNTLNHTLNRLERQREFNSFKEMLNNNKEFNDYFKKATGIPFLDFSIKSGSKDAAADLFLKGLFRGVYGGILAGALALWDETEMSNEIRNAGANVIREMEENLFYMLNINTTLADITSAGVNIALDMIDIEKKNVNSQRNLGVPLIQSMTNATSGLAGKSQNDIMEAAYSIGVIGMYLNFVDDRKSKKALGNTALRQSLRTGRNAANTIAPGTGDLLKEGVETVIKKR